MSSNFYGYPEGRLPVSVRLGIGVVDEIHDRRKGARFGAASMSAATVFLGSGALCEAIQTEYQQDPSLKVADGAFDMVATAPLDWKAMLFGVATTAAVFGAHRLWRYQRVGIKLDTDFSLIDGTNIVNFPYSREMALVRFGRKVLGTAAALATGFAAYRMGEHQDLKSNVIAGAVTLATAAVALGATYAWNRRRTPEWARDVVDTATGKKDHLESDF